MQSQQVEIETAEKTMGEWLQPAKEYLSKGQYAEANAYLNSIEGRVSIDSSYYNELIALRMRIVIKGELTPEVLADAKDQKLKKSTFIASLVRESWMMSGFTNLERVMKQDGNIVFKVKKDMRDAFGLVYDVLDKQDSENTEKKLTVPEKKLMEEKLDEALVLLKNDLTTSRYCGQLYFRIGSYRKAVIELSAAIQRNDKDITVNFFLGASYAELNEYENAKKYLLKGMSLDILKKALSSEDYGRMEKYWVACQEGKESNLDLYAQHAYSCLKVGKFQEAVDYYAVAIWLGAAKKTEYIDLCRKTRARLIFSGQEHLSSSSESHIACAQFIKLCFPKEVVKTKIHEEDYRFSIELMKQGQKEYEAKRYVVSLAFFSKALRFLVPIEKWATHFSKEECDLLQISSNLYLKNNQDEKTIKDIRKTKDKELRLLICKIKNTIEEQVKQEPHLGLSQYRDEVNQLYAEVEKAERSAQQALREQANKEKLLETAKKRQEAKVREEQEKKHRVELEKTKEAERKRAAEEKSKKDVEMKAVAVAKKAEKEKRKRQIKKEKQLTRKAKQQDLEQKQEPEQRNVIGLIFKGLFSPARDSAQTFHKFVNDVFIFYKPSESTITMVWHFLKVNLEEDSAFERRAIMLRDFFSLDNGGSHFAMFIELGLIKKFFPDVLEGDRITVLQKRLAEERAKEGSSEMYKQYLAQSPDFQYIVEKVKKQVEYAWNTYSLKAACGYQC